MTHGSDGRLYGSVTSKEIAEQLKLSTGLKSTKGKLSMSDPIKAYGSFQFDVKLFTDVTGKLNVLICE